MDASDAVIDGGIMNLPISELRIDPLNVRKHTDNDADRHLAESMNVLGQLQPILVRPDIDGVDMGRWLIVAGGRRYRAAKSLGWERLECVKVDGRDAIEISAAENFARAPMHPVDQWRAICAVVEKTRADAIRAAMTLGIHPTLARRLELLGRMAPSIIAQIEKEDVLPPANLMRTIAMASTEAQEVAMQAAAKMAGDRGVINWNELSDSLLVRRYRMEAAIFPPDAMAWDEDLFLVTQNDGERFTTADTETFLRLQTEAISAKVAASKGRIMAGLWDAKYYQPAAPNGYRICWDTIPKRFRKDDTRKVLLTIDPATGRVLERMIDVLPAKVNTTRTLGQDVSEVPEPQTLGKTALHHLAEIAARATAEALGEMVDMDPEEGLAASLRALLLTMTGDNIGGISSNMKAVIARALVNEDGSPKDIEVLDLRMLAIQAIVSTIVFPSPLASNSSGATAHWLARSLNVEMPRCDTAEVLRGTPIGMLEQAAAKEGVAFAGNARKALVDRLPEWRPVDFSSRGPIPARTTDATIEEDAGDE